MKDLSLKRWVRLVNKQWLLTLGGQRAGEKTDKCWQKSFHRRNPFCPSLLQLLTYFTSSHCSLNSSYSSLIKTFETFFSFPRFPTIHLLVVLTVLLAQYKSWTAFLFLFTPLNLALNTSGFSKLAVTCPLQVPNFPVAWWTSLPLWSRMFSDAPVKVPRTNPVQAPGIQPSVKIQWQWKAKYPTRGPKDPKSC